MKKIALIFLASLLFCPAFAKVKVPNYVSDNMMVQRDAPVKLWGWADKGETVNISLNGQSCKAKTGKDGIWRIELSAVPVGGPYELSIQGKTNTIVVKNILSGDIWICSGQSNMEMPLTGGYTVTNAEQEVANSNYPKIRLLTVNKNKSHLPLQDAEMSGWQECNPQTSGSFSAVAYFFGREIHKHTGIPIGLIHTSWGGTNIETWTSLPAMKKIPEYQQKVTEMEAPDFISHLTDKGLVEQWFMPVKTLKGWTLKGWEKTNVPENFTTEGSFWYRKEFILTDEQAKSPITVSLGAIDDDDQTYLNGQLIGSSNGHKILREYTVTEGLKTGKNELVIRIVNPFGNGGFISEASKIYCTTSTGNISLTGEWLRRFGGRKDISPNGYPSLLYNAMIAPLITYPVKGCIWYQGESNTHAPYQYRTLFPNMINDWRNAWKQSDLSFYFVQLANFKQTVDQPSESDWAVLREAQHLTLNLPNTGEAVIIDIGDGSNIHPANKQDVGYRLALNALAKNYGQKLEYSSPEYESMKIDGNRIVLTFKHTAEGLVAKNKYGYLQGFAIAGADKKFVWARAEIVDKNTVSVYSNSVKSPVAVRYAWADNPDDVNLYNSVGLPASPFRTDDWVIGK